MPGEEIQNLEKRIDQLEAISFKLYDGAINQNNQISQQIEWTNNLISIVSIIGAVLALFLGLWVRSALNRVRILKQEVENAKKDVKDYIEDNKSELFNKISIEDTTRMIKRLIIVPEDIVNIQRILYARELYSEHFLLLKKAYQELQKRNQSDSLNDEYWTVFLQHFPYESITDFELSKECKDKIKPVFIEAMWINDLENLTNKLLKFYEKERDPLIISKLITSIYLSKDCWPPQAVNKILSNINKYIDIKSVANEESFNPGLENKNKYENWINEKYFKILAMKHLIRTRLAKDIVCEVAFPVRQQGKAAIVCGGAPGTPPSNYILEFLASQGYVAFGIRYRGTWESEGIFLKHSPAKDVADVIEDLTKKKKIRDLAAGETLPIKIKYIDLFGGSFGGPAVLLNSKNKHVRKVIAVAPVIDWHTLGPAETFEEFLRYSQEAFGGAYRVQQKKDWNKLLRKDFYNPITMLNKIDPKKCFIIQTLNDDSCPAESTKALQELLPIQVYYKPKGGHFGTSKLAQKFYWKKAQAFLRK